MGKPDKLTLTREKIIEAREWGPALPFIGSRLDDEIKRLGFAYVPKVFQPGPCFVFPLWDADGVTRRAQTRPIPGSILYSQDKKYYMLGDKTQFLGPTWMGNDNATVAQILQRRDITLVEGGFDLLACRCLVPGFPIMSSLTKSIGKKHVVWLRMLGVRTIHLLFDHERSRKGDEAMHFLEEDLKGFNVNIIEQFGGGEDPSSALKSTSSARRLYNILLQLKGEMQ